jgi:hypothetical protein
MCSNAEAPKMDLMKRDAIVKSVVSLLVSSIFPKRTFKKLLKQK